jgi:signal transduction histidine kinase
MSDCDRDELAQALAELQAVQRVAEDVISSRDLDEVVARCIDCCRELAKTTSGAIYVRNDRAGLFEQVISRDGTDDNLQLPIEAMEMAFSSHNHFVVNTDDGGHEGVQMARARGFLVVLVLGMRWRGRLSGILTLAWRERVTPSASTLRTLEALMGYQAAAIENARALALVQLRAELAQALRVFSSRALTVRDEETLLPLIAETACTLGRCDGGAIARVDDGALRVVMARPTRLEEGWTTDDPLIAPVLRGAEPVLVTDLSGRSATSKVAAQAQKAGWSALAVLPLSRAGVVSGLLVVGVGAPRRFDDERMEALLTLACIASEALERARVQRAELRELVELAETKEQFLRVASHELRSPVTSLRATAQLLALDPEAIGDRERLKTLHARIDRQTEKLARLVAQLLDSTRLQLDALPLDIEEVELVALARDLAEEAGARVRVIADGTLPVRCDRSRIEQVLTNLVSNALQYSPPDATVDLRLVADASSARIEVSDRGPGIPADQLPRLFTPFFRAQKTSAEHSQGMGLGLHITREIVRRHGGTVRVSSQAGVGTTFTVELPR